MKIFKTVLIVCLCLILVLIFLIPYTQNTEISIDIYVLKGSDEMSAVGSAVPYGLKMAIAQGSINKNVTKVQVNTSEGNDFGHVVGVLYADTQGSIDTRIWIGGGIYGDADGDGSVTITDYTVMRLHIQGTLPITSAEILNRCDINRDGDVTGYVSDSPTDDLLAVYNYVLGL